ncbi:MAG: ribonuclease HI [Sutterellaceae bacterium]|nr:ribonuclease HI [Sutterellaceae bacterium]
MSETVLEIWTDGACKFNPGPGGWGVLMQFGQHKKELFGGDIETTNNRMELTAVIEAFRAVKRPCKLRLHLDSSYVKDGITKWIHGWKKKGWRTQSGPVKNVELWQELDRLVSSYPEEIDWQWVKGHAGNPGNERADELANMGVDKVLKESRGSKGN